MLIKSDFHSHSQCSYDATNVIEDMCNAVKNYGYVNLGITDHLNFNDKKFIGDVKSSAMAVKEMQQKYPFLVLGVELTPIAKPEFDYKSKHGVRDGYIPPVDFSDEIELGLSKEELIRLGVRYGVGGSHWRIDYPFLEKNKDLQSTIKEWFRQQMWLSQDERVTILAHPWNNYSWFEDFSVIPNSMNDELISALKENGKYMECNARFFNNDKVSEKFRRQYADFLRNAFERGVLITYGSDSHNAYSKDELYRRLNTEKYLIDVGFKDGDIASVIKYW